MDHSLLGYGQVVDPMMSDSDEDDNEDDDHDDVSRMAQYSTASPRGVRRTHSLQGPYSLLSLPLPSDAPDSARPGSDHSSPGKSPASAVAARSTRSLDQRLDELFAGGKLGDGISPPSSVSDRQSDVESDSLSEDELDIIKLRKPVAVTLQPGAASSQSTTLHPNSFDRTSDDDKVDQVTPSAAVGAAPLTDDMVDQIVRMKPMWAKAARRSSVPIVAAGKSSDDLSLKAQHHSAPVDLSPKPFGSENKTLVSERPTSVSVCQTSSTVPATSTSAHALSTSIGPSLTATSSLSVSTTSKVHHSSPRSSDPRCRPRPITESQSASSSDDVQQIQSKLTDKRTTEAVSTLMSPSPVSETTKRTTDTFSTFMSPSPVAVTTRRTTDTFSTFVSYSPVTMTDKRTVETATALTSPTPLLPHVPCVTSVQKFANLSVTDGSPSLTRSADIAAASSCQQTASDQNFRQPLLDSTPATTSRYR